MENNKNGENVLFFKTENVGWIYIVLSALLFFAFVPLLLVLWVFYTLFKWLFPIKKKNILLNNLELKQL